MNNGELILNNGDVLKKQLAMATLEISGGLQRITLVRVYDENGKKISLINIRLRISSKSKLSQTGLTLRSMYTLIIKNVISITI